ncbi:D-2-hydroxyacid dehydrogenase family protein [Serratia sp. M24T3]|uniref:D-2-hydroxyacid dehydrogenase family protein n=1 Tax=Serratia sp. M24T3 TaxID=932213 RepID=UPI00025B9F4A|nr:D-2-hydroxyacid dehydrogenase family protein [Serratia sp. M24T3]EIC84142.1 D-isomer specific 2-hydroxyacid dehydrogenase NAD-binding protein [Serratia sp. M24T3]
MTLRCIILDDYQNVALTQADWSILKPAVEITALHNPIVQQDRLVELLVDADILVIMRERTPITAALLSRLPKLKLLVTSGMRNAAVDLPAAKAQGVTVCGTGSGSDAPVELTWALILGLARHLTVENRSIRNSGPWQSTLGIGLKGKTLGLIGLGKIGQRMALIAQAFGMKVTAWSQNLTAERAAEFNVELAESKQALLNNSDFVSLHLVLSDRSRGIISAQDLAAMKSTAFLINTSRSGLVDQAALVEALNHRQIAGAGLDVFDNEPLPDNHPYRHLPNVLATPHLGYVTDDNYGIYFNEAIEDIQAFIAGQPVREL